MRRRDPGGARRVERGEPVARGRPALEPLAREGGPRDGLTFWNALTSATDFRRAPLFPAR